MTIKIGGKDYELKATYGMIENLNNKFPQKKLSSDDPSIANKFTFYSLWLFLGGNFFTRPFRTKRALKNRITMPELRKYTEAMTVILSGEDKELGN